MSITLWIVIAIVVIAAIVLAIVFASRMRGPRLRPLPAAARERYAESWREVETRFVDEPQQAVRTADSLAVAAYRERGGRDEDLPDEIREARELAREGDGGSMTENLRRAMQHYRSVMQEMLGSDPREMTRPREVAS